MEEDICANCSEKWLQHHLGDPPCTVKQKKRCIRQKSGDVSPRGQLKQLRTALKKLKHLHHST
ncbi:MAG: hypothetical protein WC819_04420 [Parcubacteria group bacterium]|jgi:hypothetical protein